MDSKNDTEEIIYDELDKKRCVVNLKPLKKFVDDVQKELNRKKQLYIEPVIKKLLKDRLNCNKVVILVGIPGSGKTTFGKELFDKTKDSFARTLYLSSDEYRAKLGTSESDQSVSKEVFRTMGDHLKLFLQNISYNGIVFVDATNLRVADRNRWLSIIQEYSDTVETTVIHMNVSLETALLNNTIRGLKGGRTVPKHVIQNMHKKLQAPKIYGYNHKVITIGEVATNAIV